MPVVLALDLATHVGWALGPTSGTPSFGSWRLGTGKASQGARGVAFLTHLSRLIREMQPDAVVIERPLNIGVLASIGATTETATVLYGLVFMAKTIAEARGVADVREVDVQKVRKHFTGQAAFKAGFDPVAGKKLTSRAIAKNAVLGRCRMLGFEVEDDNQADAIATWFYGASLVHPSAALAATPLFGSAAA